MVLRAIAATAVLLCAEASAHAVLTYPKPRTNVTAKVGPCGNVPRTGTPTVFAPGQTIPVAWNETIDHPGYYRVSFSESGDGNFQVLADNIPNPTGIQPGTMQIALPNVTCTACTLQLIQVMIDDGVVSNYYSCADIQLVARPNVDAGVPPASDAGVDSGTPIVEPPVEEPPPPGGNNNPVTPSSHSHEQPEVGATERTVPRTVYGGCQAAEGVIGFIGLLGLLAITRRRSQK